MSIIVTNFELSKVMQRDFDAVIGMLDTTQQHSWFPDHPNRKMWFFSDVISGQDAPTARQISEIINHFRKSGLHAPDKKTLIHCAAGISRSPAVAIGLKIDGGMNAQNAFEDTFKQRPQMWPNELILKHFDDIFGADGELLEFDRKWKIKQHKLQW
jgi:predicted protein tyrosine phosphatase